MRELYVERGWTTEQIAQHFGVGATTVRRALEAIGVDIRPRGPKGSRDLPHNELSEELLRELYLERKLSIPQIAEMCGWGRETIRQRMIEYGISIRTFSESTRVQHKTSDEYKDFTENPFEKAYLLGFRLGDLHVRRDHAGSQVIVISCGSTKPEQIELIRQLFAPYGHVHIGRRIRLDLNGLVEQQIKCSVNETFGFLENYISELPNWILENDAVFLAFLGGFTDAEGSFQVLKNKSEAYRARFSLKNTDRGILEQCLAKVEAMGIECTSINLAYKAGWTSKRGVHANKDLWQFNIERKEMLLRFIEMISPFVRHAQRSADMYRVRENIEWRKSEAFRQEATRKRFEALKKTNETKKKNRN